MSKIIGLDLGTTNSCVAVFEGNERVVDNHIKKLRKALALSRCRIHTVRKSGYRMEVSI